MTFERASTGLAVGGYKTIDKGQTMNDRCGRRGTQISLQRCWRKEKRGERKTAEMFTPLPIFIVTASSLLPSRSGQQLLTAKLTNLSLSFFLLFFQGKC